MTTFPTCRTADDDVMGSGGSGGSDGSGGRPLSTVGGGRGVGERAEEGLGDEGWGRGSLTPYRKLSDTLN